MVAVIARRKTEEKGLRPMDPSRDLAGVASLIQAAFEHELDRAGQAALREMRSMNRLGPLLGFLDRASFEFTQMLSGFVWVEEGRIVGNVTVSRSAPGSNRWVISNVAVAKPFRRRGIAWALMDAALELIREWEGKIVVLQVRHDNPAALHIYRALGFREVFGITHLRLSHVPAVQPLALTSSRFRPRRFDVEDARKDYELALAESPKQVQLERPVRFTRYRLGLEHRLADWFRQLVGGGPSLRLVLESQGRFDATVIAEPGTWWRENKISLTVHPSARGEVEKGLVSHALRYLERWRQRVTLVRHPAYHPEGIEAFKSFGFREDRTLLWMRLDL